MHYWEFPRASEYACFDEHFKLREGFSDPGGHLARCGEDITALIKLVHKTEEEKDEQIRYRNEFRDERDRFQKLSRAVQSETEKALIRRCGELEAENLLLRGGLKRLTAFPIPTELVDPHNDGGPFWQKHPHGVEPVPDPDKF